MRTALIVIGAIIVVFVIIPKAFHAWHTVSTDDAYVNSYVTFVAPRVSGQVARVLVDNNDRVKKGDILVELDPEPYRVQVAIKQAAVDTTKANLVVAQATVRSEIGQARSLRIDCCLERGVPRYLLSSTKNPQLFDRGCVSPTETRRYHNDGQTTQRQFQEHAAKRFDDAPAGMTHARCTFRALISLTVEPQVFEICF